MIELPPWTGDDRAMLTWLEYKFDEIYQRQINVVDPDALREFEELLGFTNEPDAYELAAARRGDLGPLKAKYPHLAEVFRVPKQKRGQKLSRRQLPDYRSIEHRGDIAARAVPIIRRLWQQYYGKKNRKKGERSAEWFAAKLWEVTENDVLLAIKRAGKT